MPLEDLHDALQGRADFPLGYIGDVYVPLLRRLGQQLPTTVDWPRLFELKRYWEVSLAALLIRARTLKRMSESTYLTAVKAASARGWRRLEPVPLGEPEQPRDLLDFLASPASQPARVYLPANIINGIVSATIAA